jgi:uncharacterized FlaG/YvyC family protein
MTLKYTEGVQRDKRVLKEDVMDEPSLEDKLNELVKEFGENIDPKNSKLAKLARQAQANHEKLRKSIDTLQELVDYLRVCIKYQAFDLEATRRENEYLRKLLEDNNS